MAKHVVATASEIPPGGRKIVTVASRSIGVFNAFIYNRAFGNPTDAISTITTASGKAKLTFKWPHRFAINDRLTVAGSSVGGYNVTHIITHMLSEFEVVTDRDYTADATGGTATLIIGVTASETFVGKVMFHTDVPHVFKVGDTITVADLPEDPHASPFEEDGESSGATASVGSVEVPGQHHGERLTLRAFRESAERQYILETLRAFEWNISKASIALGVERTNLHKKIRAYGIKRGEG